MLNTTSINKITNNTNINPSSSGFIQKSNSKSFFCRCHQNSERAVQLFRNNPKYKFGDYGQDEEVTLIQIMLSHDGYYLIELVKTDDF